MTNFSSDEWGVFWGVMRDELLLEVNSCNIPDQK
jgi:hypothetical protein